MKWLEEVQLEGDSIRLEPLRAEHQEALNEAAKDGDLYNLWFTSVPPPEKMEAFIATALDGFEKEHSLAFVVRELSSGKLVGSTRYLNADAINKRLEIGHTWYAKSWQGTRVNKECKLLLFQHAFETLNLHRVELEVFDFNPRAQHVYKKFGFQVEGIKRDVLLWDGKYQSAIVMSILEDDYFALQTSE